MQIHELNTFTGNINAANVAVDDGSDTGKATVAAVLTDVNNDIDVLESRIDTAIPIFPWRR